MIETYATENGKNIYAQEILDSNDYLKVARVKIN